MRKLTAVLGTIALAGGLALAGSGVAFAADSDDHSDNSHGAHNTYGNCSERHSLNVANCGGVTVLDLGNIL